MASTIAAPVFGLVLLLILFPSADLQVRAERGQRVLLRCQQPNISWVSILKGIRIDKPQGNVLMQRGQSLVPDCQDPDLKNGTFSCFLNNVTTADSATYEARVNRKKTSRRKRAALDSKPIGTVTLIVDHQDIRAERGQSVILPCHSPNTSSVSLVKWSHTKLQQKDVHEYVYLHRGGQPVPDYQLDSYTGRVELQDPELKTGNFSLILKNLTKDDSRTYECRIAPKTMTKEMLIANITLIVVDKTKAGENKARENKARENKAGENKNTALTVALSVLSVCWYLC